ncbi:MAG: TonB-dependent receptor plug domain-containing protein, partial [Mariniphaga sp.]|nr:TonB-dependent receptor plug domain-containing protein [Mariniphaga sp.]
TDTVQGAFSVSVVNENYLGSSGNSLSLKSYLLVDSELKGIVESPARYFINEDGLTSEKKLDLLMMVQGWRSYYWDDIIENAPDNMEGWADAGLIVEGNVKRLLRDKPVVGGEVVIGPFSRNFLFEETRTDNNGRFKFDRLYLKDNSVVMLNAKNERDRANTEIILDPLYSQDTVVSIDSINKTLGNIDIPMMFYRQSYFRQMAKNEFMPDEGTIMIGDVDVIGYKPQFEDDGHYRLHNEPDNSLIVTQDDYIGYSNILEYLTGRVPGLDVSGETISIRGGGQPLFLLDGVVASGSMVLETPMQDIDKIEVLKSGYATSFYGSQGGNGVIAIFTRHGDNQAEIERYIKGRIELQVNGFQQANRFYSPRYSLKNINNEEPDYRPTLYWSPEVKMNENHAEVEFFTCDELANYLVLVEGISKNGKIFSGIKKFNVTEKISKTEGIEKLAPQTDSVLYEKVYLHIDRELYSPGDTLWFKSYLTGGITNKLHKGYKNIYVQFVSPLGEVISNRLLLSQNGEAHGDFALNDSLPDGQYTVRAYTKYLENFGEESFFHKRIWISAPKSSLELELPTEKKPSLVDAMFFPEGGNLLANTFNNISFKVIGQDGRGVEASGKVINKKGDIIASFKSSFLGMGRFTFKPLGGEEYYATIDNHPEVKYKFERIKDKGLTLNFREEEKNALFNISGNYDTGNQKDLFVVATHKGIVLFYEDISMNGPTHTTVFDKKDFPLGISKVSLYDDTFNIISERLIFIDHNKGNSVAIELDKEEFLLREEVNLNLEPILSPGDSVTSALSVSVVSEDYLSSVGNNQNIKSYLLIDSELKGVIESPALYFFDEEKITSAEKLDLLMMVQGWRSYYWDDIAKIASSNLFGWVDVGLSVGGYVKELFNKNRVAGGEVRLGPYSPQLLFEETTTDNYGRFMFENLYLPDSTEVMVFATNEKGKNSVEVIMNQPVQFESVIDTGLINGSLGKINIPMLYYREIYMQQMAERAFIPDSGSIMIGEVEVVAITNEDVYELTKPFYDFYPTKSFIITEEDYKYQSIYDFLLLKVDSRYLDEVVADEGADDEGEPMIVVYLDGRKLDANEIPSLENYSMEDIYRIDYRRKQLKNAFEPDGVPETFYFYRNRILKGFKPAIWGNTVFQVNGFQQPNEFYSPKYTLESINDKMPDYRPTLYWSPEVVVKNGKANIEFFTCDNLSNYVVIVEGISKNGKICYGVERFSVTRLNED